MIICRLPSGGDFDNFQDFDLAASNLLRIAQIIDDGIGALTTFPSISGKIDAIVGPAAVRGCGSPIPSYCDVLPLVHRALKPARSTCDPRR